MGRTMPLIWMALGLVFVCALVWAMTVVSPDSDWEWIAIKVTTYTIVITLLGASMFILFMFLSRRH